MVVENGHKGLHYNPLMVLVFNIRQLFILMVDTLRFVHPTNTLDSYTKSLRISLYHF